MLGVLLLDVVLVIALAWHVCDLDLKAERDGFYDEVE